MRNSDSTRGSATPRVPRYSENSSAGLRSAPPPEGRDASGTAANSGSIRTSNAFGSTAVTSSRSPARAGSVTHTLSQSSPTVSDSTDSSATVPRTVRSRRPEVTGMSVIRAGVDGVASTRQTTGSFSCSPKSTASGAPE